MKSRLIIGCGYLGKRVAERWVAAGDHVFASTRHQSNAEQLREKNINPILLDITEPDSIDLLPEINTVLFAVGFDRNSGKSIHEVYVTGLQNLIEKLPSTIDRFIYISSTGVYGDADGDYVNEETICQPVREGGQACLAAENFLLSQSTLKNKLIILRLAGIYGPGRIPRSKDLLQQKPIPLPGSGSLNLIHVEDSAQLVSQVADSEIKQTIYNVSDGVPVLRTEYYQELARQLGAKPPVFSTPETNSPAAKRASLNRKIDTRRLQADYSFKPQYPSYQVGLAAIVSQTDLDS